MGRPRHITGQDRRRITDGPSHPWARCRRFSLLWRRRRRRDSGLPRPGGIDVTAVGTGCVDVVLAGRAVMAIGVVGFTGWQAGGAANADSPSREYMVKMRRPGPLGRRRGASEGAVDDFVRLFGATGRPCTCI
jgi:hypothetical protein